MRFLSMRPSQLRMALRNGHCNVSFVMNHARHVACASIFSSIIAVFGCRLSLVSISCVRRGHLA